MGLSAMTAPFFERPTLEAKVEVEIKRYAEAKGWWCVKFVSPGLRGVPDRLFIRRGRHVFIEIKRPDGKPPTAQQLKRHREMRAHGAEVHWVDAVDAAKEILK